MTGPELKEIRTSLGMSQKAFGLMLGLSGAGTVCRYEKGTMRIPGPVERLAWILHHFPEPRKALLS